MEKLYNDTALEQLREFEYAIRDGLAYNDTDKAEITRICEDIIDLLRFPMLPTKREVI
jgi:hypothetical protein